MCEKGEKEKDIQIETFKVKRGKREVERKRGTQRCGRGGRKRKERQKN